jgi:Rhodopirellula transposase.
LAKCDGGGSNNANHYIFKEDLQKLVNEIGVEIRIAHYPPYTSKYNPIEHRLFPHITLSLSRSNFYKFRISQSSRGENSN